MRPAIFLTRETKKLISFSPNQIVITAGYDGPSVVTADEAGLPVCGSIFEAIREQADAMEEKFGTGKRINNLIREFIVYPALKEIHSQIGDGKKAVIHSDMYNVIPEDEVVDESSGDVMVCPFKTFSDKDETEEMCDRWVKMIEESM